MLLAPVPEQHQRLIIRRVLELFGGLEDGQAQVLVEVMLERGGGGVRAQVHAAGQRVEFSPQFP